MTLVKLYLYNLVVEIVPIDGKNLPELINELRDSLSQDPNALNLFENKLIYYGYFDIDVNAYKERRYQICKENYYLVQGEFPRIKKDVLLLGVSDVRYTITLAVPTENIVETVCLVFAPIVIVEIFKLFRIPFISILSFSKYSIKYSITNCRNFLFIFLIDNNSFKDKYLNIY